MEPSELNWRGVAIFALAVLTAIVLISVIDDDPIRLGINTPSPTNDAGDGTDPGATTTTSAGATTTTTVTTRPGATTTTALNPVGRATLSAGASGADVTVLQQRLTTLGYYKGAVDGSYGPGTVAAVTAFQTAKNLTPADGVVGPATWTALSTS